MQPIHLWNVVPAAGGRDAETLDSVRLRAPEVLKATDRAITQGDFEELAMPTPGTTVARAHASVGRHPLFPKRVIPGAITVFLVPDVPRKSDRSPDYGTDDPFPDGPGQTTQRSMPSGQTCAGSTWWPVRYSSRPCTTSRSRST